MEQLCRMSLDVSGSPEVQNEDIFVPGLRLGLGLSLQLSIQSVLFV